MDIGLPDIDGIEVTRQIRQLNHPQYANIPIIAVTGHAKNAEQNQTYLKLGIQYVFTKPATPEQLKLALDTYILKEN